MVADNVKKTESEVALLFIYIFTVFSKTDLSTEGRAVRTLTNSILGWAMTGALLWPFITVCFHRAHHLPPGLPRTRSYNVM